MACADALSQTQHTHVHGSMPLRITEEKEIDNDRLIMLASEQNIAVLHFFQAY